MSRRNRSTGCDSTPEAGVAVVNERSHHVWERTVLAASALVSLVLVLLIDRRYGPGLSPDSAEYVAAATSLLKGEGLLGLGGNPLVRWPPLFPVSIAVASVGLLAPVLAGGIVNGLAFAATVVLGVRRLRRSFGDSIVAVGGSIAIVLGPPLLLVATFVWAEAVFVLLTLLCLLRLSDYLEHGRRRDLLLAALLAGLSTVTRYAGVTLIMTGLVVLTIDSNASKGRKLRSFSTFLGIAVIPLSLYVLRNLAVSSTVVGAWGRSPGNGRPSHRAFRRGRLAVVSAAVGFARIGSISFGHRRRCTWAEFPRPEKDPWLDSDDSHYGLLLGRLFDNADCNRAVDPRQHTDGSAAGADLCAGRVYVGHGLRSICRGGSIR